MQRITLVARINGFSGYGMHGIQIARDLTRLIPAHVSIRAINISELFGVRVPDDIRAMMVHRVQPEDFELLLDPPMFFPTPGKRTIYFTMWESTKLPPIGPRVLNMAECVICPTLWNASCFSASGVTVPIRVVPLGIKTEIFNYATPVSIIHADGAKSNCVFGTGGRMAHGGVRKGINEVIRAFLKAFPDEQDVQLRVKAFPDCKVEKPEDPRVDILQAMLTEHQMREFYASLTCFVSAATGEGWGLMQQQAMSCGRPVISVEFGGVAAFFNDRVGYPIEFKLECSKNLYEGCGLWAVPNEDSLIDRMRYVYEHRAEAEEKGVMASQAVAHLSWENSNRMLCGVLKEFGVI